MDFKNYSTHAKELGIGGNGYYKLEEGENKVRIVSHAEPSISHFVNKQAIYCPQTEDCAYCKENVKKTYRVLVYVVDRKDEEVKLAELPWSVFKAIGELANSSDYGFEGLPPFDLVIKRTGEGLETRYSLLPGRNDKPISQEQESALKSKKPLTEIIGERLAKSQVADFQGYVEDKDAFPL